MIRSTPGILNESSPSRRPKGLTEPGHAPPGQVTSADARRVRLHRRERGCAIRALLRHPGWHRHLVRAGGRRLPGADRPDVVRGAPGRRTPGGGNGPAGRVHGRGRRRAAHRGRGHRRHRRDGPRDRPHPQRRRPPAFPPRLCDPRPRRVLLRTVLQGRAALPGAVLGPVEQPTGGHRLRAPAIALALVLAGCGTAVPVPSASPPRSSLQPAPVSSTTAPVSSTTAPVALTPSPPPASLMGKEWSRLPTPHTLVALTFDAGNNDGGVASIRGRSSSWRSRPTPPITPRWTPTPCPRSSTTSGSGVTSSSAWTSSTDGLRPPADRGGPRRWRPGRRLPRPGSACGPA